MKPSVWFDEMDSPVGRLRLAADGAGLRRIDFLGSSEAEPAPPDWIRAAAPLKRFVEELESYFDGALRAFEAPLAPQGTAFQQDVWSCLRAIPYGATTSYGEIAARIGRPKASRAVGLANGRNPIPIIIPCHRVVGKDGSLVGYGGGLHIKRKLLALERARLPTLI